MVREIRHDLFRRFFDCHRLYSSDIDHLPIPRPRFYHFQETGQTIRDERKTPDVLLSINGNGFSPENTIHGNSDEVAIPVPHGLSWAKHVARDENTKREGMGCCQE